MSDRIRIVRSNDSHIDGIYEIEKSVFAVPWSKKALYEDIVENILSYYVTALSEKEKRVVGYGGMWLVQDEAHVTNIAVDKAFQGKGVGSAILEALIRKCEISDPVYDLGGSGTLCGSTSLPKVRIQGGRDSQRILLG